MVPSPPAVVLSCGEEDDEDEVQLLEVRSGFPKRAKARARVRDQPPPPPPQQQQQQGLAKAVGNADERVLLSAITTIVPWWYTYNPSAATTRSNAMARTEFKTKKRQREASVKRDLLMSPPPSKSQSGGSSKLPSLAEGSAHNDPEATSTTSTSCEAAGDPAGGKGRQLTPVPCISDDSATGLDTARPGNVINKEGPRKARVLHVSRRRVPPCAGNINKLSHAATAAASKVGKMGLPNQDIRTQLKSVQKRGKVRIVAENGASVRPEMSLSDVQPPVLLAKLPFKSEVDYDDVQIYYPTVKEVSMGAQAVLRLHVPRHGGWISAQGRIKSNGMQIVQFLT